MIALDDPLWRKLCDAYATVDIPGQLRSLEERWDDDLADHLLYAALIHQETCYSATYAAMPHILKLAETHPDPKARGECAAWLAWLCVCAADEPSSGADPAKFPPGMPANDTEWRGVLETKRIARERLNGPDRDPFRGYHDLSLPSDAELEKIAQVAREFAAAHPRIAEVCANAYLASSDDGSLSTFLMGIAAARGLLASARLLETPAEAHFSCPDCGTAYLWHRFDKRIAYYLEPDHNGNFNFQNPIEDRDFLDWQDGAPSRQDGFVVPLSNTKALSDVEQDLWDLAVERKDSDCPFYLAHIFGSFDCVNGHKSVRPTVSRHYGSVSN